MDQSRENINNNRQGDVLTTETFDFAVGRNSVSSAISCSKICAADKALNR